MNNVIQRLAVQVKYKGRTWWVETAAVLNQTVFRINTYNTAVTSYADNYSVLVGERNIGIILSVCVCVCLSVAVREHICGTSRNFCTDPLWPWLGPPLAALRYLGGVWCLQMPCFVNVRCLRSVRAYCLPQTLLLIRRDIYRHRAILTRTGFSSIKTVISRQNKYKKELSYRRDSARWGWHGHKNHSR